MKLVINNFKILNERLRYINKIIFWVIFALRSLPVIAQNEMINEMKIDSLFKELENIDSLTVERYNKNKVQFVSFYESSLFDGFNKNQAFISEAYCHVFKCSYQMDLLREIYIFSQNEDNSINYTLVDTLGHEIKDLEIYNCNVGEIGTQKIKRINKNEISDVISSYKKWYDLMKKNGCVDLKRKSITPISFTQYKWQKEIGLIIELRQTNKVILDAGLSVLNDSIYMDYFIKKRGLKFYSKKNNKEIISQLILLSLINNQYGFTPYVLNFVLTSNVPRYSENTAYILLKEMLEAKVDFSKSFKIIEYLEEKKVVIIYNW